MAPKPRAQRQSLGIGIGRSRGHVCKARAITSKSLRPPSVYSFCRVRTFSLLGEKREGVVFSRPLRALRASLSLSLSVYVSLSPSLSPCILSVCGSYYVHSQRILQLKILLIRGLSVREGSVRVVLSSIDRSIPRPPPPSPPLCLAPALLPPSGGGEAKSKSDSVERPHPGLDTTCRSTSPALDRVARHNDPWNCDSPLSSHCEFV